jgi:hypothetical protein
MGRSFIIATAGASALMFAGVWTVTAPTPGVAASESAIPAPMPAPSDEPTPVIAARSIVPSEPYNVVRPHYGYAAPSRDTGSESSVYYRGCREARAAGAAPIYRGQPGYRPEMDGDDDGIACEPYRG